MEMRRAASVFGVIVSLLARVAHAGEGASAPPPEPTTLDDVPSDPDPGAYEAWRRGLSPADRREVARRCNATPVEPLELCHGIGPLGIGEPPQPEAPEHATPAAWEAARAGWLAALAPAQQQYVATQCKRARNVYTTLCGGTPPHAPQWDPDEYWRWYRALSSPDRQWVDRQCRAHPADPDPACLGIGPLHLPTPPGTGRPGDQAAWKAWYAGLSKAQQRYHDRLCRITERAGGPNADDLTYAYSALCGGTPLVAVFDEHVVHYHQGGTFAFTPGAAMPTDWPTAATPWLARDLDGDGAITSGAELFGSSTVLPDGRIAAEGFAALAALDANHDGRIDAADPAFATLLLWADRDADRRSAPDELVPLASRIISIALAAHPTARCDARSNCEGQRAAMQLRTADGATRAGAIVDVYLPFQLR